jgi:hypothetical protein
MKTIKETKQDILQFKKECEEKFQNFNKICELAKQ